MASWFCNHCGLEFTNEPKHIPGVGNTYCAECHKYIMGMIYHRDKVNRKQRIEECAREILGADMRTDSDPHFMKEAAQEIIVSTVRWATLLVDEIDKLEE